MDEPFSSLDAPTRESLQVLTINLQKEQNLTVILVTHMIEEAVFLGKKILLLGESPHTHANTIKNLSFGNPGIRNSQEYIDLCERLRSELDKFKDED